MLALRRSATGDDVSEYHLLAGIAACHAVASDYASTDWPQILAHYDERLRLHPSLVVALNRVVALAMVRGAEAGLAKLDLIRAASASGIESYYLLHCTAAELHRRASDYDRAIDCYRRAQSFTITAPEQRFIARRIAACQSTAAQPA